MLSTQQRRRIRSNLFYITLRLCDLAPAQVWEMQIYLSGVYIYTLLVWVSFCFFVCLFPINVKTAEPFGPNFLWGFTYKIRELLRLFNVFIKKMDGVISVLGVNYHASDGVISVLSVNYHASDGVISVLSVHYYASDGVISVLSVNYHASDGVISHE